jgi:lysophospholipase L1-like esterase
MSLTASSGKAGGSMSRSSERAAGVTAKRLGVLIAVSSAVTLLVLGAGFWIRDHVPEWVYWKTGLVFLIAAETTYCVTVATILIGAPVSGALLIARRRNRTNRRRPARGLLLCASIAIGLFLAEAGSGIRLYLSHRDSAIPGGTPAEMQEEKKIDLKPPGAASSPPTEFRIPRGDREIEIAIVGESSAEGVPYNRWTSVGQILAWQLEKVFPDRSFRPHILAASGSTLELQHAQFYLLTRRPDVLLIYCGHNEFSTRFNSAREPRHYFDEELPTLWSVLVERLESTSALCGLIRETAEKCRVAIPPPRHGHRALVDVPVYTTTEYTTLLMKFRRRLESIVSYAEQIGAMPVLIAPPANDAGFEPNRSFLPASTPRSQREAFARDFLAARRREAADPQGARLAYQALLTRQPGFAEAHYRLAQLLERAGSWDEAYHHYRDARDCDGFPMRCLTAFQAAYREVADRHRCILIDGQAFFHAVGRDGLLDEYLFHDGMHPSLRGQIALAQAVLHELRERKAFGWPRSVPAPIIDPEQCVRRFHIDKAAWEYLCLWGIMFYDLTYPLRYDSTTREQKKLAFGAAFNRIKKNGESPEAIGLPNIGLPEPVRAATSQEIRGSSSDER